jgi:hypothetical protein
MCDCLVDAHRLLPAAALLQFGDHQGHIDSAISLLRQTDSCGRRLRVAASDLPFTECLWCVPLLEEVLYLLMQTNADAGVTAQVKQIMSEVPRRQAGARMQVAPGAGSWEELPWAEQCRIRLMDLLVRPSTTL